MSGTRISLRSRAAEHPFPADAPVAPPRLMLISPRFPLLAFLGASLLISGCAPRLGDFGRPVDKEGARFGNSFVGNAYASGRGERCPISNLPMMRSSCATALALPDAGDGAQRF